MRHPRAALATLLLLGACTGGGAGKTATISFDFESFAFGNVPVDEPATRTGTLTASGEGFVEVLSVELTDGRPDDWTLTWNESAAVLAAGESLDVDVTFAPKDVALIRAVMEIETTDPSHPLFVVDLSGNAIQSQADDDGDGFTPADGDCDDNDEDVYPGAEEICDGRDNDCDNDVPHNEDDGDDDDVRVCDGDCNDDDATIFPGAPEICDDLDNDCDDEIPDRLDADGDGFDICADDCDDADPLAFPTNVETCDAIDNDCNGVADDLDADGDGRGICGLGSDCDDDDPDAWPVIVDAALFGSGATGDGTQATPYSNLTSAVNGIDEVCRTIVLLPGSYEVALALPGRSFLLIGTGDDPSEVVIDPPGSNRALDLSAEADIVVENLTIANATPTSNGGGIRVTQSTLTLRDVVLVDNEAGASGGALAVVEGTATLERVTFRDNISGAWGGAIYSTLSTVSVTDSTFETNDGATASGAIYSDQDLSLVVERSAFRLNTTGGDGGAIVVSGTTAGTVRNNTVQNNLSGGAGGGIALIGEGTSVLVANNTLTENSALSGGGIEIGADVAEGASVLSNIVADSAGADAVHLAEGSPAEVDYNTVWATAAGVDFDYTGDVDSMGPSNTSEDPLFTAYTADGDPTNDDLSLGVDSPAINTGPIDAAFDDADGTRNDRGATGGPAAP